MVKSNFQLGQIEFPRFVHLSGKGSIELQGDQPHEESFSIKKFPSFTSLVCLFLSFSVKNSLAKKDSCYEFGNLVVSLLVCWVRCYTWYIHFFVCFLNLYFDFRIFRLGANRRTEVIDEFKANSVQVNDFLRACISQNAQRYVCSHFLFLKCPLPCIPYYLFSTSGISGKPCDPDKLSLFW